MPHIPSDHSSDATGQHSRPGVAIAAEQALRWRRAIDQALLWYRVGIVVRGLCEIWLLLVACLAWRASFFSDPTYQAILIFAARSIAPAVAIRFIAQECVESQSKRLAGSM